MVDDQQPAARAQRVRGRAANMAAIYAGEHADHTTRALPSTPNATGE